MGIVQGEWPAILMCKEPIDEEFGNESFLEQLVDTYLWFKPKRLIMGRNMLFMTQSRKSSAAMS